MSAVNEQPLSGPALEPLPVFLLDAGADFDVPQQHALALAQWLRHAGYAPSVFCPPASPLFAQAQDAGIAVRPLPQGGLMGLFRLWLMQRRARPLCLHSFDNACLPLVARLLRLRRPGSTMVLHSCFSPPPDPLVLEPWHAAEKVVCAHATLRSQLAAAGLEPARLAVVHPGRDIAALPPRYERNDGRFVFMAQERLLSGAGLDVLIKAMGALWQREDLAPWEVRVVGSGPAFETLLQEAHALGVASRLAFLSDQPLEEVLPQGDVLVAPGTAPHGNLGALMSAWCVGLPLICSAVPAHMEVARAGGAALPLPPGANALTVPPGDPQALAAAMIRLMTEGDLRLQLGQQGAHMRTYADFERVNAQYLLLYQDCVGRHGWVLPTSPPPVPE